MALIRLLARSIAGHGARLGLATLNLVLLFYCALLAAAILSHHPMRVDLSARGMNTLSDDTLTCLANLQRPVEVVVAYGEPNPRRRLVTARVIRRAKSVLRQMALAEKKLTIVDVIEIYQRGEAWDRLKQRYDLTEPNRATFICGGRRQDVRLEDMADIVWGGPTSRPAIRSFRVERAFTGALRRLQGEPRTLYILKNDGTEGKVGPTIEDKTRRGFSELAAELTANNYDVEELDLKRKGEVPRDCDVLLAVGLIGPLPHEVPPIIDYLKRGGKFFLALNPLVEPSRLRFLGEWGFYVESAWTVMHIPLAKMVIPAERVMVTGFNPLHPITRKFEDGRFRMDMVYARPINAVKGARGDREAIILTKGENIWGERKIDVKPWAFDPQDIASPITLAGVTAVEREGGEQTRIAVFGSASFLTNGDLRKYDHLSVLHNTLWWLLGQEELVSIAAPEDIVRDLKFDPEGELRGLLSWTLLLVVPGCSVLVALAAYFIRRR